MPLWFDLLDLGKSTCVLNYTIQLWNSVFMFSMEVGSVRNITVYLWASEKNSIWRFIFFGGNETSGILGLDGYSVRMALQGEGGSKFFSELLSVGSTTGRIANRGQVRNYGVGKGFWGISEYPLLLHENPSSRSGRPVFCRPNGGASQWPDQWSSLFDDLPQQTCSF